MTEKEYKKKRLEVWLEPKIDEAEALIKICDIISAYKEKHDVFEKYEHINVLSQSEMVRAINTLGEEISNLKGRLENLEEE
jgi:iron uptake system EfeUOB component EfeO/EfeM